MVALWRRPDACRSGGAVAEAIVKKRLDVSASRLWKLVADFAEVSWMPGVEAEIHGEGPGMVRVLGDGDSGVHERLESLDEAQRRLVYTIPRNNPLPLASYRATMVVSEVGDGAELRWSCEFEPKDVTEEQARAAVEGIYGTMIGWISDHLGARTGATPR
jgi:hypothetical protein